MTFIKFTLFFIFAINFYGCSSAPRVQETESKKPPITSEQNVPPPSSKESSVNSEFEVDSQLSENEKALVNRIKLNYDQKNFKNALYLARQFFQQFPQSTSIAQVYNYQGLSLYLLEQNEEALHSFKSAARYAKGKKIESYIQFNIASVLFDKASYEEILLESQQVIFSHLDSYTRFKFQRLLFYTYQKVNRPLLAIDSLMKAEKNLQQSNESIHSDSKQLLIKLEEPLHESLLEISNIASMQEIYEKNENSFYSSVFLFRLAELHFKARNFKEAGPLLTQFKENYQESPFFQQATDYLRTLEGQDQIEPLHIGVLLPMSGKFAPFGLQTLNGIEHALRIYDQTAPPRGIKLIIEDSGDSKEQALNALNKLFFDSKVVAIIGPLLSKGITEVTQRAQDLGVPLISLAQQRGIQGDFIFYASVTPLDQAQEIARVAVEQQKLKRFAILYPEERFGKSLAESFWNTVESLGGEIVAVETYKPNEPDFREAVDKLIGTHYQVDRKLVLKELENLRKKDNITKKTPKTEKYYKLPPLIEFDAVFIPDEAKSVAQALPTFTYRDADQVKFLGISTWNSPLLIQRAAKEAAHSFFVDTFYTGSDNPQTKKFMSSFNQEFGYSPTATEAFAFDAASILERTLLVLGSSTSRSSVRKLLSEIENFRGATGNTSAQKDGTLKRPLKVLTVRKNKIIELD